MNRKQVAILKQFLDRPAWQIAELTEGMSLSQSMVRHELRGVNDYLLRLGLPEIETARGGGLRWNAGEEQKKRLASELTALNAYDYSLSAEERQAAVVLYLTASRGYLTSGSFAESLSVSKSCIDKDLAALRELLPKSGLFLDSCAGKGSRISGDERTIRSYCCKLILRYVDLPSLVQERETLSTFVGRCAKEIYCDRYIRVLFGILKALERDRMNKQFSDKSFGYVLICLAISLVRLGNGCEIALQPDELRTAEETEEFSHALFIADEIARQLGTVLPREEVCFLSQILTGAQFVVREPYMKEDWAEIQILSGRIIKDVSLSLGRSFDSDAELHRALQNHLGRTVFNLRHRITTINPALPAVRREYAECFETVKSVIESLDTPMLERITDDDIAYITVHFCASAERSKRKQPLAHIAIVCTNGAGTASLLKELLCSRFPGIRIAATTTSSDLDALCGENIDFVVSSVQLKDCPFPYIKVGAIPSEGDYARIEEFLSRYTGSATARETSNLFGDVMSIVQDYISPGHGDDELCEKLRECFVRNGFVADRVSPAPRMMDLLTANRISCGNAAGSWQEAVAAACRPLLESGDIDTRYVRSALESVKKSGAYIVIAKGVALVHSQIGRGVNRLAFGISTFPDGVVFHHPDYDPVSVVFCLAPTDAYSHTNVLGDLIKLLEKTDARTMAGFEDNHALHEYIAQLLK